MPCGGRDRLNPGVWGGWVGEWWCLVGRGGVLNGVLTFHEGDGRVAELLPSGLGSGNRSELGGVGPSSDGKEGFHVPMLLLQHVQLLHAAICVLPLIVPRVCGVVFLKVRVRVGWVPALCKSVLDDSSLCLLTPLHQAQCRQMHRGHE